MKNALVLGTGGVGSVIGQRLHTYDCYGDIYLGDVYKRQLKWSFFPIIFSGFIFLFVGYLIHSRIFKT